MNEPRVFRVTVKGDISELILKLEILHDTIKIMSQQIEYLTIELEVVKTKKEINTNDILSENKIKCDSCEYTASTNTVLKRHVTINHKKNAQLVEIPNQFKCELCEHDCKSESELESHISIIHEPTFNTCFFTNCTNVTNSIIDSINIYNNNYTNISICESCLEGA